MAKSMPAVNVNGASIPAIGMGTWTLSGEHCAEMVVAALAAGYRHLDTAAMYGNEEEVGAGLKASGIGRAEVFVTTKVWWTDIAPGRLERSAEDSLRRLGIAELDLLLIHWPNPDVPLDESIGALNACRSRGLTRHIGVSNFPTAMLRRAIAASEAPLVANQVEYHPFLDQSKLLSLCRQHGMALVAYCPLYRGRGLFEAAPVRDAALRLGKSPAQIVLRWHLQQPGVAAIPRTTRKERLAENIAVFDFELSGEEMTEISALSSANRRLCDYDFAPQWDAPSGS